MGVKESMDVYADLLFLVNFCMDYVSLLICARASGVTLRRFRAVIGATFGGVYSVAALFFSSGFFGTVLAVLSWLVISLIAFYRRGDRLSRIGKLALMFLGAEAILGGVVSAVFTLLGRITPFGEDVSGEEATGGASRWIFVALGFGALAAYFLVCKIKRAELDRAVSLKISVKGREAVIPVFLDSGNLLKEPMSGRPCTVVSCADIEDLVGKSEAEGLKNGSIFLFGEQVMRAFAIPARTVEGRTLLYGFLPDEAALLDGSGRVIKSIDTVVAVRRDDGGEGKAILPTRLL